MTTQAKRRTVLALVAVVGVVAGVVLTMLGLPDGRSNPDAFAHGPFTPKLRIDADVTNGTRPCDPLAIDAAATVAVGAVHKAGVCLVDWWPAGIRGVEGFELHVRYSGDPDATPPTTLNVAPTKLVGGQCPAGDPYCLNANPDANDGDDPTGYKLGGGWDCTAWGYVLPVGDDPGTPGVADARIICNADGVNPDEDLTADPGLLATIEFTATSPGVDTIDFGPIDENNPNYLGGPQSGSWRCWWPLGGQMDCSGATITKVCADKQIGNGKGILGEDGTVPDSPAGLVGGNACGSTDVDNDGIPNGTDPDPGGDITYDDNNNGVMCPTDPADDGPSWDSDCDGIRDGVEGSCPLAVNPNGDDDGDGLPNTWEVCKWGTNPAVIDSDGDTLGDCKEAADVDGNRVVNYTGDVIAYAKAALVAPSAFGQDGDFDIDGNNVISFTGDVIQEAEFAFTSGLCK